MPKTTKVPPGKDKTRPVKLSSLEISGPANVNENDSGSFTCTAYYRNGSQSNVSGEATWQVDSNLVTISGGVLKVGNVDSTTPCVITATYGGKSTTRSVTIIDTQQPSPPNEDPPPTSPNRIVIDPITRIEGHLRIEVEIQNNTVVDAWSSGTLFRGIEMILRDRDPEEAWLITQRLCGVCTYVHGSTSVRCVEDALGLTVPVNARVVRNLMMGAQFLHDHIVHFYHLHALDWVDLKSALEATPAVTEEMALAANRDAPVINFSAVQDRLQAFVTGGQLGPFANNYWPHDAYLLDPEENLLLAGHYLEALRLQTNTARMHAIFGGKNPHSQNLRVGGITCRYDLNDARIEEFRTILDETKKFIDTVYLPDVALLAQAYGEWAAHGAGHKNYLAYGEFPQSTSEPASLFFPRGAIFQSNNFKEVDTNAIEEHVKHSWYSGDASHHPSTGETVPNYTGIDTKNRYSWLKAPRYQNEAMEAGPLARMLVAYHKNHPLIRPAINNFLDAAGLVLDDLHSTLGRTAARALETQIIANEMYGWLDQIQINGATYQSATMPMQAAGMGLNEAPRGAVGHWIDIQNQKIGNYQMVIPSTWNFGPRCGGEIRGPAEEALIGTPVQNPEQPVEILRTIHSLDPCIACAVHVIDPANDKDYTIRVY
jgi:[NiFe] hydrogenase large subunit